MKPNIDEILSDKYSGSIEITKKSFHYYKEIVDQHASGNLNPKSVFEDLQANVKRLLKKQPNMAILRRTSSNLLVYVKRLLKSDKDQAEFLSSLYGKLQQIVDEIESNVIKITQTGSRIIAHNNRVMTISNSSMVRNICLQAHHQKRKFEVYALKSHPPDEGIIFARELSGEGIKTTVIPDSALGIFLADANLVLLGADRIYEDGFVNKAGTLPLCLTAKEMNIPVYLAVDTSKILKQSERAIKFINQDGQEVYSGNDRMFNVENIYFERIPLRLVHKVICEDGVFEYDDFINWYLKE